MTNNFKGKVKPLPVWLRPICKGMYFEDTIYINPDMKKEQIQKTLRHEKKHYRFCKKHNYIKWLVYDIFFYPALILYFASFALYLASLNSFILSFVFVLFFMLLPHILHELIVSKELGTSGLLNKHYIIILLFGLILLQTSATFIQMLQFLI